MATQANRRPRMSKRWERQNSNAAATATAAPQTSAYPKSNSACSLHSTGAAGKRDMQRLLVDCSTLPNESFVVWQHFWSTNIADRLALHRPVATPFYRKQTHTANRTMRIFADEIPPVYIPPPRDNRYVKRNKVPRLCSLR